ncbi:MAG: ubiquinol-cytochrome c reductase iron-sulfur subunit [Tatlockia sp.]|nr:ubiquinol-cytochrome c reductase iron-sulfur subunit [Tatlockia sp.]
MTVINNDKKSDVNSNGELIDERRRRFLIASSSVLGGIGLVCAMKPFISSWLPSSSAQAAGLPIQVDLTKIEPGQQLTVEWRGKPIWIIRRTPEMLTQLKGHNAQLRDPNSQVEQQPVYAKNIYRSINPEYLVLIGICTHLGCVPKYTAESKDLGAQWPGGFYCPCHGSTFDLAGRVLKGVPAPINLEVPPYYFKSEKVIVIGQDEQEG